MVKAFTQKAFYVFVKIFLISNLLLITYGE